MSKLRLPRRARRARRALALSIFLGAVPVLFAASPAFAEDEAVIRFERGVQLYEADNFDAALVEFTTAYKLSKNYKLLYNVGICQMASKEYAGAAESFRQYLSEGGADINETRRKDVQDRLSKLGLMLSRVRVTSNAPAGTTLLVDDRPVGTVPLAEPLTVKTGKRQFSVVVAGRTVTKVVAVTSGDVAVVDLVVVEASSAAPEVAKKPPGPAFPWPMYVVTGVLGGAAVVTGVVAVGARNDLGEARARYGASADALNDDASRARTFGYVTDGLLIGTVLAAGLSTYLTIRYFNAKGSAEATAITVTPASVHLSRSF